MMTSCLHGVQTMQTPMISCHVSCIWWEWNVNANDVILTWFASHANPNDVTSGMHDSCVHAWQMSVSNSGAL